MLGFIIAGPLLTLFIHPSMWISLQLFSLMAIDGLFQAIEAYKSNNFVRLVTGVASGYANYTFIYHIILMIIFLV